MNNSKFYNTYLKCINPSIIAQQDDQIDDEQIEDEDLDTDDTDTQDDVDLEDDSDDNTDTKDNAQSDDSSQNEQAEDTTVSQKKSDTDLKFSADLASQFGNTVNKFTRAAAQVIKQRTINKEQSDNIYNLMGKIKDLLDAAGKSV